MAPGKLRRLLALADYEGRLQMLRADHGAAADRAAVGRLLSTQASAVVLDAAVGLPAALHELDRGAGLVVPLSDDDGGLIEGWSVAKALRVGAEGVLLGVAWPAEDEAVEKAVQRVDMLGDECAKHELVLIVEVRPASDAAPETVAEAAERLSAEEQQVDLLALPLPARLTTLDAYAHGALDGVTGQPTTTLEELTSALELVEQASAVPWLLAGDAYGPDELVAAILLANQHGASGFLAGAAFRAEDDTTEEWLASEGVHRLRRAVIASEGARPWFAHRRYGLAAPPSPGLAEGWLGEY